MAHGVETSNVLHPLMRSQITQISSDFVTVYDLEDKLTEHVCPYVLDTTVVLLGCDCLSQWGVSMQSF